MAPQLRYISSEKHVGGKVTEKDMHAKILSNREQSDLQNNSPDHGRYANYFKIGHNAFEFLLDFGQSYAQDGNPPFHTRIVTTPVYAKTFLRILEGSISRYEELFGTIPNGNE